MHHTIEFMDGSGRCRIRSAEMPANNPRMSACTAACDVANPDTRDVGGWLYVILFLCIRLGVVYPKACYTEAVRTTVS